MKVIIASIGAIALSATAALAQNVPATPESNTTMQSTSTTTAAKTSEHKAVHHRVTHKKPRHHKVVRHVHKTKTHIKAKVQTSTTKS